jgi:hypothetical protein
MAFVTTHWTVTRSTKIIDYIGDAHAGASPSYATGIELHRQMQDWADDPVDGNDDEIAIIDETPTDRAGADTNIVMLNGYTLTATALEHIYDCSITQAGGDEYYDGIQVFGNSTSIQIIQDGARLTNDFWNEPKMIAATSDAASSTSHRFLVQVRVGGADIDGRRLLGTQRVLGTSFTEFFIGGGTNRGNNTLALTANPDGNNQTAAGTIATWVSIVNTNEGYTFIDADGQGTATQYFYGAWDIGTQSKNDLYERGKWIQREGSVETIYGLNGDLFRGITHEITLASNATGGTWVEPEEVSWTGGTGQLLAVDDTDDTASTKMWIQILTGVPPTNTQAISGATASADCSGTPISRTVPSTFIGTSTGSAINPGAFGVGIESADLTVADQLVDLTNTSRTPPNNVQFNVTNLVSGDRVLVGPATGNALNLAQFTVNGTLNGAAVVAIVMNAAIPTDTPASGTIRVQNDEGRYVRIPYTSYTGSTFTIPSYDFSGAGVNDSVTTGNNAFISYLDLQTVTTQESFTSVYLANRQLFIRVRNAVAQIKTFESTGTLGSSGGSATTGRIDDF